MTTPRLYILSRPSLGEGIGQFLESVTAEWKEAVPATPAERLVEFAGRICYMSFGARQHRTDNLSYLTNLIVQGHESVLEHANWTFLLTGISRAFSHQLVRHRVGFSFSQLSQQYHDESEATFVEPFGIESSPKALAAWQEAVASAKRAYSIIREEFQPSVGLQSSKELNRATRSAARSVLPNATTTAIVVSANARSIRDFLRLRGAIEGDYEMRAVSKLLYDLMSKEAPNLVEDFLCSQYADGSPVVQLRTANRDEKT